MTTSKKVSKSSSTKVKNKSFPNAVKALKSKLSEQKEYLKYDKQALARCVKNKNDVDEWRKEDIRYYTKQIPKSEVIVAELQKAIAKLS